MMSIFFVDLVKSVISIEYYQSVLSRSFFSSLRFYLAFLALIALILTGEYWLKTAPQLRQALNSIADETINNFPVDLTITWSGNRLFSSTGELIVPFPDTTPQFLKDYATDLAVINPSQEQTSQNAFFELTPTKLYVIDQGQRSSGVSLPELLGSDQILINQQSLPELISTIKSSALDLISLFGYIYPIWAWFGLIISRTYLLVIEASLIFILIRLQRWPMKYLKVIQLCLHIFIPAEIINQATRLAGITSPISMLMLSFWVMFVVIFFALHLQRQQASKKS